MSRTPPLYSKIGHQLFLYLNNFPSLISCLFCLSHSGRQKPGQQDEWSRKRSWAERSLPLTHTANAPCLPPLLESFLCSLLQLWPHLSQDPSLPLHPWCRPLCLFIPWLNSPLLHRCAHWLSSLSLPPSMSTSDSATMEPFLLRSRGPFLSQLPASLTGTNGPQPGTLKRSYKLS